MPPQKPRPRARAVRYAGWVFTVSTVVFAAASAVSVTLLAGRPMWLLLATASLTCLAAAAAAVWYGHR